MVHMFIYSFSPHFFGWAIQHLSMLKTYGNEDKYFSLSLHSSLVLQPFNLSSIGKRVGRRARGGKVFISESSSTQLHDMFPLEGTLMIPSPNGICLRSIRAPHYDDVSTGIMSDRISSAPVGWATDKMVTWDRWNHITGMTSCVIKCEMKPGTNVVYWCLLFSCQRHRDMQ